MFGRKLKQRRADLGRTLADDPTQPPGWESWTAAATSVDQLHATCPHPGWLAYCAYWADVSQDKLLEATMALLCLASERDPTPSLSPAIVKSLRDDDGPDLGSLLLALEQPHPMTLGLVDLVPSQLNFTLLGAVGEARIARRNEAAAPAAIDLGPFRTDPGALATAEVDAIKAAGYVLAIEAIFHRSKNLRESLATRAAASAALLCGSFAGFHDEAMTIERRIYGW
jgi:hypothetical protein